MFVTGPAGAGKCKQQYYSVPSQIVSDDANQSILFSQIIRGFLLMQNSSVKISAILSAGRQFVLQQ
jgi:hypothetical protein